MPQPSFFRQGCSLSLSLCLSCLLACTAFGVWAFPHYPCAHALRHCPSLSLSLALSTYQAGQSLGCILRGFLLTTVYGTRTNIHINKRAHTQ